MGASSCGQLLRSAPAVSSHSQVLQSGLAAGSRLHVPQDGLTAGSARSQAMFHVEHRWGGIEPWAAVQDVAISAD